MLCRRGDRWRDLCQPIPVVKPPNFGDVFGLGGQNKRKKKRSSNSSSDDNDFGNFFDNEEAFEDDFDDGFFDAIEAVDNLEGEDEKEEPGIG